MAIYMKGQWKFFQEMDKLSAATRKEVLRFVNETAERVKANILTRVPVGATGELRKGIEVFGATQADAPSARVGAIPWYALPVEFGYLGANAETTAGSHGKAGRKRR